MKQIELKPVKESTQDYEKAEKRLRKALFNLIYEPVLKALSFGIKIKNSIDDLVDALNSGKLTYSRSAFRGEFNSEVSRELRLLGAKWKNGAYHIPQNKLPIPIWNAISNGNVRFREKAAAIDKALSSIEIKPVKFTDIFKVAIGKVDYEIGKTLGGVMPKLSDREKERIAEEWQNNMDLWIKDFTEKEIINLRETVADSVAQGNRYEYLIGGIRKSYGVSKRKAKFLARQETSLLMAKFKEVRYNEFGIKTYKWYCVAGTKLHPVRPSHKKLEGKVFSWNDPPITTEPGESIRRNNPGQDYNCRCYARPIVKLRDENDGKKQSG